LVYKHAISTIMPGGPLKLHDDEDEKSSNSDAE
jgi:sRNA-binding regulator protein Hfq